MPGEGAGAYFGVGYETADGIPGPITQYMQFESETFKVRPTLKPNPNINPRGTRSKARLVKMEAGGGIKGAPDSESQARLRAHHRGFVTTTTLDAPNNVYSHAMRDLLRTDTAPATYRKTINGVIFRDDARPQLLLGGKVSQVKITAKEYDYIEMVHDIRWGHRSNLGDPIVVAVNGAYTGKMWARGTHRSPENVTDEIYVKVTTGGALDGTAKIKVKKNLAAAYSGAEYSVVGNTWITVEDEAALALGPTRDNPLQILLTLGGVLTVNDEWKIPARRTIVAPTYTARDAFTAADLTVTIGGVVYKAHQWELTGTHPRAERGATGTIFPDGVNDSGQIEWDLDIDRDYIDLAFVNALESGAIADVNLRLIGDKIGASVYREEIAFRMRNMQYGDAGAQVSGANQQGEKPKLMAYDPVSFPICEETHINTIPAL